MGTLHYPSPFISHGYPFHPSPFIQHGHPPLPITLYPTWAPSTTHYPLSHMGTLNYPPPFIQHGHSLLPITLYSIWTPSTTLCPTKPQKADKGYISWLSTEHHSYIVLCISQNSARKRGCLVLLDANLHQKQQSTVFLYPSSIFHRAVPKPPTILRTLPMEQLSTRLLNFQNFIFENILLNT